MRLLLHILSGSRSLKISTVLTIISITLGVGTLVTTLSVTRGFEKAYKRSILDFNAHVILLKEEGMEASTVDLVDEISNRLGIESVSPFIYHETLLIAGGNVKGVVVKGIENQKSKIILRQAQDDTEQSRSVKNQIFLGTALANELNEGSGSFPTPHPERSPDVRRGVVEGSPTVQMLVPSFEGGRFQKFEVAGTFESGLYDYDSRFAFMDIDEMARLFKMGDKITGVEMKVRDVDKAAEIAGKLERHFPYPFFVTHWAELNRPIFEAVKLEKIVLAIIIGLLVVAAAFNIIGVQVLKIIEKTSDIAILRAIGMRASRVIRLFSSGGALLGVIGTASGLVIGLIASWFLGHVVHIEPEIYFLSKLPIDISLITCLYIAMFSIIVSALTALIASRNVARINIVEGINK